LVYTVAAILQYFPCLWRVSTVPFCRIFPLLLTGRTSHYNATGISTPVIHPNTERPSHVRNSASFPQVSLLFYLCPQIRAPSLVASALLGIVIGIWVNPRLRDANNGSTTQYTYIFGRTGSIPYWVVFLLSSTPFVFTASGLGKVNGIPGQRFSFPYTIFLPVYLKLVCFNVFTLATLCTPATRAQGKNKPQCKTPLL